MKLLLLCIMTRGREGRRTGFLPWSGNRGRSGNGRRKKRSSEKFFLFQVRPVGSHVSVDQAVTVALDGCRLVVGRLVEQLGQRAVSVLHADGRRLGERRRPLSGRPIILHGHRHVRVLLAGDVVRAARQFGLLSLLPCVENGTGQSDTGQER